MCVLVFLLHFFLALLANSLVLHVCKVVSCFDLLLCDFKQECMPSTTRLKYGTSPPYKSICISFVWWTKKNDEVAVSIVAKLFFDRQISTVEY